MIYDIKKHYFSPSMKIKKFAAIDIGSNAMRLLIMIVVDNDGSPLFIKDTYLRLPVRLGGDAFDKGKISEENIGDLLDGVKSFKHILKINRVDHFKAYATSAMRTAINGIEIIKRIAALTGIEIEIISGKLEAEVIKKGGGELENSFSEKTKVYVDVGGGSTEISIENNGEVISESFNIGTIRLLHEQIPDIMWQEMKSWVKRSIKGLSDVVVVGSGGNINKVLKIFHANRTRPLSSDQVNDFYCDIKNMTVIERMKEFRLKSDRADVIEPAIRIFVNIMKWSNAQIIHIPKIGLSDGIIKQMYLDTK